MIYQKNNSCKFYLLKSFFVFTKNKIKTTNMQKIFSFAYSVKRKSLDYIPKYIGFYSRISFLHQNQSLLLLSNENCSFIKTKKGKTEVSCLFLL
jgi:hypothetical protein